MTRTNHRSFRGGLLAWGLTCGVLISSVGCASHSLSEPYPEFYSRWNRVPPELRAELESARSAMSDSNGTSAPVIRFARVAGLLAQEEARSWLDLSALHIPVGDLNRQARLGRARQRVVEASTHALTLFREFEYRGGQLDLNDQLVSLWLLLLRGDEREALLLRQELLASSDLPVEIAQRLSLLEWNPELSELSELISPENAEKGLSTPPQSSENQSSEGQSLEDESTEDASSPQTPTETLP